MTDKEIIKRAKELLTATVELLQKQSDSPIVLNILEATTTLDTVECEGYVLLDDINDFLDEVDV